MLFKCIFVTVFLIEIGVCHAAPFTVSGNEVTDSATGLVWRQCPEGMTSVTNSCTGSPTIFTHESAMTHARGISSSSGVMWRLPSIKELSSIVDKSISNPAIDVTFFPLFPSTPGGHFWSSTPSVRDSRNAMLLGFGSGGVTYGARYAEFYVRLVRAGQ